MPLTPQEQAELNGLLQKHGLISAGVQPDSKTPQSWAEIANASAQNVAQGATMGWGDEVGAAVAKPLTYALKNLLPEGMGGEDVSYGQVSDYIDQNKSKIMEPMARFNEDHPIIGAVEQMVGGVASGTGIGKLAKSAAPGVTNALTQFAKTSPYLASSGTGGVTGALYGAGASEEGQRGEGAIFGGVGGAVLGPALNYLGRNLAGPALEKGGKFLQKFLSATEAEAPVPPQTQTGPISSITNAPLGAQAVTESAFPASATGKLPLSPGVANKDANLLRVEELARQGNLGQNEQSQMLTSDAGVYQAARNAMQQLKGITNKDSDSLFSDAVSKFQEAGRAVKASAQGLFKARDEMMADAVLDKKRIAPSLGRALNDVTTSPENVAGFKSKSGAAARQLYDDFQAMIKGVDGDGVPFSDLAAWRADAAHLATTDESTSGHLAKKLIGAYESWMDNLDQKHLLSGNPEVASTARAAGSAWRQYKTMFGSENSPLIEGMVKPFDMKPMDFVDGVFGKNIEGTAKTALNLRKMTAALPEEAQQEFKNNVFRGMISRVFEGAGNADTLSLKNLRNNLSKLQNSQVYKEFYAQDGEKNTVITNLIKDLSQHITQTSRRDVTAPSGGYIMRGIQGLLGAPANIPIVNKVPYVRAVSEAASAVGDLDQKFTDKKLFNRAMKEAAKQVHAAARDGKVFDIDSLKAGLIGGNAAGAVVQINQKEKKE